MFGVLSLLQRVIKSISLDMHRPYNKKRSATMKIPASIQTHTLKKSDADIRLIGSGKRFQILWNLIKLFLSGHCSILDYERNSNTNKNVVPQAHNTKNEYEKDGIDRKEMLHLPSRFGDVVWYGDIPK